MVQIKAFLAVVSTVAAVVNGGLLWRRDGPGSPYNCGCASRKQALLNQGATVQDLAIAFQETGSKLSGQGYNYGDGKGGDSANFGLFKNNWYMIRTSCSQFHNASADMSSQGAVLNNDDAAAIKCQHEQQSKYGSSWWGGQRDGSSGIQNPNSGDIQGYKTGVQYIQNYLQQGHTRDDMTTSYNTHGI